MSPLEHTSSFLDRLNIRNTNVVVAVSGGADSVCLLRTLHELKDQFALTLHVAHFDHATRLESTADARFAQQLAEQLGVNFHLGRRSEDQPVSEESLRNDRYAFLERICVETNSPWLAMGHTADDQAETVLQRILRGTGLTGLKGIPTTRSISEDTTIIRPLLTVTRTEIVQYLESLDQTWCDDESNSEPHYTRNRIRHEVLPLLRDGINRDANAALCRLADQAEEVMSLVDELAQNVLDQAIRERTPNYVELDVKTLQSQHPTLVKASFRLLWELQGWPLQKMSADHWEQLTHVAISGEDCGVSLPGKISVHRGRGVLSLTKSERGA